MSRIEAQMEEAMEARMRKREMGTCVKPDVVTIVVIGDKCVACR